ncbi:MAG: hypothetical protein ABFE08_17775 [Armatimonadia bacterium]
MTTNNTPTLVSSALPQTSHINTAAARRVAEMLPELMSKVHAFDRHNTQTTLTLMSLTMLNGHSPFRLLRQILAETESRLMAFSEAQVGYAELLAEIEDLNGKQPTPVVEAKLRQKYFAKECLEGKINGAMKDVATLADAYEAIKAKHGIEEWDEVDAEAAERTHHTRRAFELLYRNVIETGRAKESSIEYLQQYGVHAQIALAEVIGYIQHTDSLINAGERPTASHLEDFLDQMAEKYKHCAEQVSERLFGKRDIANSDYMLQKARGGE